MKKKALLSSLLTIALCLSLIAGSTFALFTSEDTVNIAVNAGTVKMTADLADLRTSSLDTPEGEFYTDGHFTAGGTATFDGGKLTLDRIVPGDKVSFRVVGKNESNVNIKYRVKIACTEGEALMAGLAVTVGNEQPITGLAAYTGAWCELSAKQDMPSLAVSIELPAEAGNAYQGLNTAISITVEAVQGNADVSGEAEVTYLVSTKERLTAALATGNDVTLAADIAVDGNLSLKAGATLNGNGHTLTDTQLYMSEGSCVVNTVFDGTEAEKGSHIYAHDVSVTVDGCRFLSPNWDAIQFTTTLANKTLILKNSQFANAKGTAVRYLHVEVTDATLNSDPQNGVTLILENNHFAAIDTCTDDGITVYGVQKDNVKVTGNTASAKNSEAAKGEVWLGLAGDSGYQTYSMELFEEIGTAVSSTADLTDALTAGATEVTLGAGAYTFPSSLLKSDTVLICEEGTVFEGTSTLDINGATVVGATFSSDNERTVTGTVNGTFKNCTFEGNRGLRYCYAGETTVFENCIFDGSVYGAHFDGGANEVIFRNCTFSGFNAFGSAITKLTMENCTFKCTGKSAYNGVNLWGKTELVGCTFLFDGKAETEWIGLNGADAYSIVLTDCTVANGSDITEYFANWSSGDTITVDGATVVCP